MARGLCVQPMSLKLETFGGGEVETHPCFSGPGVAFCGRLCVSPVEGRGFGLWVWRLWWIWFFLSVGELCIVVDFIYSIEMLNIVVLRKVRSYIL
jgi:hypothetical protein